MFKIPLVIMKLLLVVVVFEEIFVPHSGLRSSWDTIRAKLDLINEEKILNWPSSHA